MDFCQRERVGDKEIVKCDVDIVCIRVRGDRVKTSTWFFIDESLFIDLSLGF